MSHTLSLGLGVNQKPATPPTTPLTHCKGRLRRQKGARGFDPQGADDPPCDHPKVYGPRPRVTLRVAETRAQRIQTLRTAQPGPASSCLKHRRWMTRATGTGSRWSVGGHGGTGLTRLLSGGGLPLPTRPGDSEEQAGTPQQAQPRQPHPCLLQMVQRCLPGREQNQQPGLSPPPPSPRTPHTSEEAHKADQEPAQDKPSRAPGLGLPAATCVP